MTKCCQCQEDVWCAPFQFDNQVFCTSICLRQYRKNKATLLLAEGQLSLKEIREQCHFSITTLYNHIKKLKLNQAPTDTLPNLSKSRRSEQSLEIEDLLRHTKYSYTEIAKMYGLTRQRIGQIAVRANLAREKLTIL